MALQDWRIKFQILILQVISSVFTMIIVTATTYIYFQTKIEQITQTEQNVLLNRQMPQYTNSILILFQESIDRLFLVNEKYLMINQNLLTYVSQNKVSISQQVDQCLQIKPAIDQAYNGQFCYGIFGEDVSFSENYFFLTDLMTESLPMLDITNLYFASTGSEQFMTYWPGQPFGKFVPHSRPWYKNHIEKMNETKFVFSDPYLNYFGGITLTATANLSNEFLVGVSGIDISLDSVTNLTRQFNFLEVMIIDQMGKLILCEYYDEGFPNISYFQNSSLTGFDESDFQQIQMASGNYISTCDFSMNTLCLKDNNGTDWSMISRQIVNPSYTIIFKIKTQLFTEELSLMLEQFEQQWVTFKQIQILIALSISIVLIMILVITSIVIQKPIDQILYYARSSMKNQKSRLQNCYSNVRIINELNWAFRNLLSLRVRNNEQHREEARYFRKLNYPINEMYLRLSEFSKKRMIDRELNLNEWAERNCSGHHILRNNYFLKQMTMNLLRGSHQKV